MYNIAHMNILMESFGILISVMLLLLLLTDGDRKSKLGRLFMRLVLLNLAALSTDMLSWVLVGNTAAYSIILARAAVFICLCVSYLATIALYDYIAALLGEKVSVSKNIRRVVWSLTLIAVALVVASQFTNKFYYFDENNMYRTGEFFRLSEALGFLPLLIMAAMILRYRKSLGKNDTLFLMSYPSLTMAAIVCQSLIKPELELLFVGSTLSLLAIYSGIQSRQIKEADRVRMNYVNSLENIMDGINTSIYVIEPQTCRLLFVNKWLKAYFGRENDDLAGEFCYKVFRGFDEMCSFCPCARLMENPKHTIEWEEFFEPSGVYVRHLFCYIDWPNGGKVILQYGIDTTEIHEKMELHVKMEKQERELAESRTLIMLSQIQPHFLYNSLTSISDMCKGNPEAKEALLTFSEYLRGNMNSLSQTKPVPFTVELRHIKQYLWLERMRFEERLKVEYDIKATDFLLPALSVQPIVENAVHHGLFGRGNGGTVTVRTEATGGCYRITVTDNGMGFDIDATLGDGRAHIGIENVRSRLTAMCGGTLMIQSSPGAGTTAIIEIPKEDSIIS